MKTLAQKKSKVIKFITLCLAVIFALFCFQGCVKLVRGVAYIGNYFGADLILYLNENVQKSKADKILEKSRSLLENIEKTLSTENRNSEISVFNGLKAFETMQVSKTTYDLVCYAKELNQKTDGYFSPAVYYLLDLYGFTARHENKGEPTLSYDREWLENVYPKAQEEYVEAFTALADFSKVVAFSQDEKYYLKKDCPSVTVFGVEYNQKIDLASVAKGYAVNRLNKIIEEYGLKEYYLSFGTSSIYLAENKGEEWGLELVDPNNPTKDTLLTINLKNQNVSTSGTYENAYEIEGKFYHHIIDPKTGYPCQNEVLLACVIGSDALVLDSLSTAVVALGVDSGVEFLKSQKEDYSFVIVTRDNKIYTNVSGVLLRNNDYTLETIN